MSTVSIPLQRLNISLVANTTLTLLLLTLFLYNVNTTAPEVRSLRLKTVWRSLSLQQKRALLILLKSPPSQDRLSSILQDLIHHNPFLCNHCHPMYSKN